MKRSHTDRQLAFPIHGRSAGSMRVGSVMSNTQGLLEIDFRNTTLLLPRPVIALTYFVPGRQSLENENQLLFLRLCLCLSGMKLNVLNQCHA